MTPRPAAVRLVAVALALVVPASPRLGAAPSGADDYAARESDRGGTEKKKEAPAPPPWDVNNPPGHRHAVAIDTTEGTFLNLDVRPQGDEIAFDLLGDIYLLPIAGGEARALRSGMAWEMQPRFSPDGEWIAFTSDLGGGDNLWLMRRDGSEARAVTKEDFRLVNSPAWSPDGEFVAGRKHFTGERSLGAGEIWLYHRSGGKGVAMTSKSNDQKDLGEPVFSPDGRFLYFSRDATPGKSFEYNKDPHGQIYVIDRLDREDGRIDTVAGGAGGAVRPTPSPDGRSLAFVRRIGLKTALVLATIESGHEVVLDDALDRDLQETWAIHGVYPAMSFTPDSRSIVYWAGGKIRRVDVATRVVSEIPFRVRGTRTVSDTLRFPVEVQPPRWHTRALRWVTVSPDGAAVVFQALGHLHVRELPAGVPRRLTRDEGGFEMFPSFSRDGRSVVYTTWSDRDLGSVRIVPLAASPSASRTVTAKPGHYVEPALSPDGKWVVFRKVGSDALRSREWTSGTGIYAVPVAGGEPKLVTASGDGAHFATASDRVFFQTDEGEGEERRRLLKSIGLDRSLERTHARSELGTDFRVSPDGHTLAFQERYNVFVTPLPATGRPIDVGPKSEALPVARVSRDGGNYLHWSGDGQRLYWSLGPELMSRELKQAFASLAGDKTRADDRSRSRSKTWADSPPPPPPAPGLDLGFDFPTDVPKGTVALTGGRVVTMRGGEVIEHGTVVVTGNRIAAVGADGSVAIPPGAERVDLAGKTVLPGLVDVHYHGPQGDGGILPERNWSLDAALAFGVTTVHDPSTDTDTFFAAAELARAGAIVAPRLFSTGTVLYGARTPFQVVIDSLDDARSHLRRLKAVGAFSVKSYNQPRREQRQQVIAAARELGMMVVPEGGSLLEHNLTQVVDGHTGIEHALPIATGYRDVIQLWAGTAAGYTPTLVVAYGGVFGENYWYQESDVFAHPRLTRFVPPFVLAPRAWRRMMLSPGDWNHPRVARFAHQLAAAGVGVQVGAHGQREGLGAHWEMWSLAQGGFTPHEALRAGTLAGARYLGLDRDLGSIEPGKLADLFVVDGDPLADLRRSEQVVLTMKNGRIYDAATMDQVWPEVVKRAAYFWQTGN